ncbi:MAG TPA: amino acid permease [Opitutales bacterium]|nr:amino acid permease [Opitutales bacterium]
MNFLRRKSVADLQTEAITDNSLHRALGRWHLVFLGIGCTIGAGVFVLTGLVAANMSGPAVVLSYVLAGTASVFAALCYSEFASLVPMSGSAYTYSYATLGEIFAWIIGWDLILEYAVGGMTVAIGWSGHVNELLKSCGVFLPPQLSAASGTKVTLADGTMATAWLNLPAVFIVAAVTILLVIGIRESAHFNNFIVVVKLAVIAVLVIGAAHAINFANWEPFIPARIPPGPGHPDGAYGWAGVFSGAGLAFFAYIGFDAVSTAAQEAKDPQSDMPFGIIGSLVVCTILYILVAAVATGVVPYAKLGGDAPMIYVAQQAGMGEWVSKLVNLAIVAGLSSVIMVLLMGQSRIFWNMSRDGLLPPFVNKVHPKFKTPWITSIITGIVVAACAATLTLKDAGDLCNIGTLLAFVIVCISVLVLRIREPHHHRKFTVKWLAFVAPAGALSSFALMCSLPGKTWIRLIGWFLIGMVIYFSYSIRHSRLREKNP